MSETPESVLASADDGIKQADAKLADLEQRVVDGDSTVTPDQIESARQERWWAGLQRRKAEKRAAALRESQAQQARTVATIEAKRILEEVPQADVDQALKTASNAMTALRETVRRRNDVRARALRVLRDCPAIEPGKTPQGLAYSRITEVYGSHGQVDPTWRMWSDGQPVAALDEAALMDRARKAPADADEEAQRAATRQARARRIEDDAALWHTDWPAFEALGAARRKAAVESTGANWDAYLRDPARPRISPNRI